MLGSRGSFTQAKCQAVSQPSHKIRPLGENTLHMLHGSESKYSYLVMLIIAISVYMQPPVSSANNSGRSATSTVLIYTSKFSMTSLSSWLLGQRLSSSAFLWLVPALWWIWKLNCPKNTAQRANFGPRFFVVWRYVSALLSVIRSNSDCPTYY